MKLPFLGLFCFLLVRVDKKYVGDFGWIQFLQTNSTLLKIVRKSRENVFFNKCSHFFSQWANNLPIGFYGEKYKVFPKLSCYFPQCTGREPCPNWKNIYFGWFSVTKHPNFWSSQLRIPSKECMIFCVGYIIFVYHTSNISSLNVFYW